MDHLINDLHRAMDAVQDAHFPGWGSVTVAVAKAIVELEELRGGKDLSGWISVHDMLPLSGVSFLVANRNGEVTFAEYDQAIEDPEKRWGYWEPACGPDGPAGRGDGFTSFKGITHWMPVPDAPASNAE